MKSKTIDKLARIAEEQRGADGLPVFDFAKLYAAMPPEQQIQFSDYLNGKGKAGNKMCITMSK